MADKDDSTGRRDGGLDDSDDVGNGQAGEQWPHGKVLEASGRRWELVAEGIVLHVDLDKIVEARGREAENAGDLLGVEQVGGLVPVNPHAAKVVAQQVVQRVSRKERQAVRNPVGLVGVVIIVRLCPLAQVSNRLGSLLVSSRPDAQANTVQSMGGVLLEDKGMVNAVGLAAAGANLDIMGEACLKALSVFRRLL